MTAASSEPYLVISADCHAGLPTEQYRPYVDPDRREAFDQALAERERLSVTRSVSNKEFADRWFGEKITTGPFAGEKIDRGEFEALRDRFYRLLGLNGAGVPSLSWHRRLAETVTGFAVEVALPEGIPGAPEGAVVVDEPVSNVAELRDALSRRLPHAARKLEDRSLVVSVNGGMILANEKDAPVRSGDRVAILRILSGG
jgi:sulfur carrier protein ThiS